MCCRNVGSIEDEVKKEVEREMREKEEMEKGTKEGACKSEASV